MFKTTGSFANNQKKNKDAGRYQIKGKMLISKSNLKPCELQLRK